MAPHPAVFALIGALLSAVGGAPASAQSDDGDGASSSTTTFEVVRGDTLTALLTEAGGDAVDIDSAIDALRRVYDPGRLRVGQTVTAVFRARADGRRELAAVGVALDDGDHAVARRDAGGGFRAARADEPPGGATPDASRPAGDLAIREIEARRGDTLTRLAVRAGATRRDADLAIRALTELVDPTSLQIGQTLQVAFSGRGADATLTAASLKIGDDRYVVAERRPSGDFASYRRDAPFAAPPAASTTGALDIASAVGALVAAGTRVEGAVVARGDTIVDLMVETGATAAEAHEAARALARHFDPRRLQIGHRLHVARAPGPGGSDSVLAMAILDAGDAGAFLVRRLPGDGGFAGERISDLSRIVLDAAEGAEERGEPAAAETPGFAGGGFPLRVELLPVEAGDTLMSLLRRAGAERAQADLAIRALRPHYDLRRMQIGQQVRVAFENRDGDGAVLVAVGIEIGEDLHVHADLRGDAFSGGRTAAPVDPTFQAGPASPPPSAVIDAPERPASGEDGRTDGPAPPASESEGRLSARAEQIWFTVRKDDTIAGLLRQLTANGREIGRIVNALAGTVDPANLEPGAEVVVVTDEDAEGVHVIALSLDRTEGGAVAVVRQGDGGYASRRASRHVDLSDFTAVPTEPDPGSEDDGVAIVSPIGIPAGGTLMRGLLDLGVDPVQADEAVDALRAVFDPRDIRAGQTVEVSTGEDGLLGFAFVPQAGERIEVARAGAGFASRAIELPVEKRLAVAAGRIETSLYQAAVDGGVPYNVLEETIRAYSFDIDFQREIHPGDSFELLYEEFVGEDGVAVRHDPPLHAVMRVSGSTLPIYRFTPESGFTDYFNDRGESVRKALLRTPIDGARITSLYGMRTLGGFTRMHRGVDFGAPVGTPVLAAGDGVIERLGWYGGYGNYVRIRHNGAYKTAYAHLSGYAKGLDRGARVRQGQAIGYVGNTGNSTGPHLHYEVLIDGEQIDPLDVDLPSGEILEGAELAAFHAARDEIDALFARVRRERLVAHGG